jgi:hypothetical protein
MIANMIETVNETGTMIEIENEIETGIVNETGTMTGIETEIETGIEKTNVIETAETMKLWMIEPSVRK